MVCLATDPEESLSFINCPDDEMSGDSIPVEWYDKYVIIEVKISKALIKPDSNIKIDPNDYIYCYEYEGIIPWSWCKIYKKIRY